MKLIQILTVGLAVVNIPAPMTVGQSTIIANKVEASDPRGNLAAVATASSSSRFDQSLHFLNDGLTPTMQGNRGGSRQQARSNMWIQYEWTQPISTREISVYWWNYNGNIRLPESYHVHYWDGNNFLPAKNASGLGLTNNQFNATSFDEVKTTKLRLELDSMLYALYMYRVVRLGDAARNNKYVFDRLVAPRFLAPRNFQIQNYYSAIPQNVIDANPLIIRNPFH